MANPRINYLNEGYSKAQQAGEAAAQRRTDNAIELMADSLKNLCLALKTQEPDQRRSDPHDYVGEP